ncbi:MAG TPA: hemerythrin domain-containing protein [Puia sp.]|nr:hemerythrin domain-containing protein [Puia sp.]
MKRNKHIVSLSHDHHDGLLFCWKLRQGVKNGTDPERILGYVRYFWQDHLLPHFRLEEEILFVDPDDEKIARALREHREMGALVQSLLSGPPGEAYSLLQLLADAVDNHIRFEERELFPYLEKELSEDRLAGIGHQLNKNPHLPDAFPDAFWKASSHSKPGE